MSLLTLFRRTPPAMRPALVRAMSLYPPFVGAGIRIVDVAADLSHIDVALRLRPWNRNVVGQHFGGSLYAMCDPFFLFAVSAQLGPQFLVWDRSARIEFRRPGRGTVRARFAITPAQIADIRAQLARGGKCEPEFCADVLGPAGEVIATVHKRLWIKDKSALAAASNPERTHGQPTA